MGSFNSDSEVHRDAKSVLLLAKAKVGVNHQRRESFKFTRACLQSFHEPSQNNGNGLFRDCLETVKSTDSKPSPTKGTKPLPFFLGHNSLEHFRPLITSSNVSHPPRNSIHSLRCSSGHSGPCRDSPLPRSCVSSCKISVRGSAGTEPKGPQGTPQEETHGGRGTEKGGREELQDR